MRFTLDKHTHFPVLHIAAVETFEFIRDNHKITDELVDDLDLLPSHFGLVAWMQSGIHYIEMRLLMNTRQNSHIT